MNSSTIECLAGSHQEMDAATSTHECSSKPERRFSKRAAATLFCLALTSSFPAAATNPEELLLMEISEEEWLDRQQARSAQGAVASTPGTTSRAAPKPDSRWVIPRYRIDNSFFQDETTFYSVRNEANERIRVLADYYSKEGVLVVSESFDLDSKEVKSRNLRDVPNLLGVFDTTSEGYVLLDAFTIPNPIGAPSPITVDYFSVDSANDFASGGPAFVERCRKWTSRFVNFGDGPSKLDFYVQTPGSSPSDPFIFPAATIGVYTETGAMQRAFDVITSARTFTVDLDPLLDGSFGVVEIDFGGDSSGDKVGLVSARHSAQGRFSVAGSGVCLDP